MTWFFVAIGGAFGALARFGLLALIPPATDRFPTATFLANVLGCFVMGAVYILIVEKPILNANLKPLVTVGFLGAFTTFSSFSIEALSLWSADHQAIAAIYLVATVVACLFAVWAGANLCERLFF